MSLPFKKDIGGFKVTFYMKYFIWIYSYCFFISAKLISTAIIFLCNVIVWHNQLYSVIQCKYITATNLLLFTTVYINYKFFIMFTQFSSNLTCLYETKLIVISLDTFILAFDLLKNITLYYCMLLLDNKGGFLIAVLLECKEVIIIFKQQLLKDKR